MPDDLCPWCGGTKDKPKDRTGQGAFCQNSFHLREVTLPSVGDTLDRVLTDPLGSIRPQCAVHGDKPVSVPWAEQNVYCTCPPSDEQPKPVETTHPVDECTECAKALATAEVHAKVTGATKCTVTHSWPVALGRPLGGVHEATWRRAGAVSGV